MVKFFRIVLVERRSGQNGPLKNLRVSPSSKNTFSKQSGTQFSSKIDLLKNQWPHAGLPHAQPQEVLPRKSLKKTKPDSLENMKESNAHQLMASKKSKGTRPISQ